jgi:hypothetical protein
MHPTSEPVFPVCQFFFHLASEISTELSQHDTPWEKRVEVSCHFVVICDTHGPSAAYTSQNKTVGTMDASCK